MNQEKPEIMNVTGPIYVEGAKPGNALKVDILDLKITSDEGIIIAFPGKGGFSEKIKEIKRNLVKTEIETFIHGAMCTSISGRCYFSQDISGTEEKSANRGNCEQPCRRRWWVREESGTEYIYNGVRFLNSRDLCTIAYIPDLIKANIVGLHGVRGIEQFTTSG